MTLQSSVNIYAAIGIQGDLAFTGPNRVEEFNLDSEEPNVIGYAYSLTAGGNPNPSGNSPLAQTAQVGGTGVFAGILINNVEYFLPGVDGVALAPTMVLPNESLGSLLKMGQVFVNLGNTASVGDVVYYDNTTGALGSLPPTAIFTASVSLPHATGTLIMDSALDGDTVTVGVDEYTFVTALSTGPTVPFEILLGTVEATASGTLTLGANADPADSVVIGVETYTFVAALSSGPTVPFEVLIGAAATNSIDNLIAAVTAGAGSGTLYSVGTTANADATAAAGALDTMTVTAIVAGSAGNSIDTLSDLADGSFADTTLTGGSDESATTSLENLVAAINGAAGAGTTYSTGTTANEDATAEIGGAANLMDVTAIEAGEAGNAVDTLSDLDDGSFAAATLTGGSDTTNTLNVSAVTRGVVAVGALLTGAGIPPGVYVTGLGTGSGGTGSYDITDFDGEISSESMSSTTVAAAGKTLIPNCTVDTFDVSVSGLAVIKITN